MNRLWIIMVFFFVAQAKANPFFLDPISFPKAEILNKNTARIPFRLIDNLIVVEAQLYNKKGNFVIDTGSKTLILNKVHFPDQYELYSKIY